MSEADIKWTEDNWQTSNTTPTKNTGLNIYVADIILKNKDSRALKFTFFWKEIDEWEKKDYLVKINSK